jgi:hypothetical protein
MNQRSPSAAAHPVRPGSARPDRLVRRSFDRRDHEPVQLQTAPGRANGRDRSAAPPGGHHNAIFRVFVCAVTFDARTAVSRSIRCAFALDAFELRRDCACNLVRRAEPRPIMTPPPYPPLIDPEESTAVGRPDVAEPRIVNKNQ